MKKCISFLLFCLLTLGCFYVGTVLADRSALSGQWIRIHVVANSDSEQDQAMKLQVRNAVLETLEQLTQSSTRQGMELLEEVLPELCRTADAVLSSMGSKDTVRAELGEMCFPQRQGDGYSLPAGVYQTLRLTIGQGQGHNWWGVLFPQFGSQEVATSLTGSLANQSCPRFYILEKLGELETRLHRWRQGQDKN